MPSTSAGRLLLNMRNAYRPSSDRILTAGLSGLGSLHIICPDSQGANKSSGWPLPFSFGFLKKFPSPQTSQVKIPVAKRRRGVRFSEQTHVPVDDLFQNIPFSASIEYIRRVKPYRALWVLQRPHRGFPERTQLTKGLPQEIQRHLRPCHSALERAF